MEELLTIIYSLRLGLILLVALTGGGILFLRNRRKTVPLSHRIYRRSIITLTVIALLGALVSEWIGHNEEKNAIQQYSASLPAYAHVLQSLGHQYITEKTPDNDQHYLDILAKENEWRAMNPRLRDIYTLRRQKTGSTVIITDNATDYNHDGIISGTTEERPAIGTVFPALNDKINPVFDSGQNVFIRPYHDDWGYWVTVIAPIYDSQGRVEAAVAIDAPAISWLWESLLHRFLTFGFFGFIALIQIIFASHAIETHELNAKKEERSRAAQYLAALVNCFQDAVISTDLNGYITSWNHGAETIYGYPAQEAIGQHTRKFTPEERMHDREYLTTELLQNRGVTNYETFRIRKDSSRVWVSLNANCVRDDIGRVIGFCYVVRDITETREIAQKIKDNAQQLAQTNRELSEANAKATAATQAKSEFLANMSHEIRTPMTAILGYTDILASPDSSADERNEAAQVIRRNGQHLLTIINDILDISKIEVGRLMLDPHPYSPIQLIGEVASLMRVQAIDRGLALHISYDTPIPESVYVDPTRMRQIILNLVGNAVKFTEKGCVNIRIRYTRQVSLTDTSHQADADAAETGLLQISIQDTGIGIKPECIKDLFQPFWQADHSMTRKYGGAGLGLNISRRLAQVLGGDITVASESGVGSTFTLTVRVNEAQNVRLILPTEALQYTEKHKNDAIQKSTSSAIKPLLYKKILLVEDGPDNQRLISYILKQAGAVVTVAENGRIGVDKAWEARESGQPYQVILMDMQMPVLDGYAATRELRERGYDEPIIALTAHAMTDDRKKCIMAGCDDYATKPIDKAKLVQLLLDFTNNVRPISSADRLLQHKQ